MNPRIDWPRVIAYGIALTLSAALWTLLVLVVLSAL